MQVLYLNGCIKVWYLVWYPELMDCFCSFLLLRAKRKWAEEQCSVEQLWVYRQMYQPVSQQLGKWWYTYNAAKARKTPLEKLLFCICTKIATSAKTLHTMSTIAPFSVITGNLYFNGVEQHFLCFWTGSVLLSREDTSLTPSIKNFESIMKAMSLCTLSIV